MVLILPKGNFVMNDGSMEQEESKTTLVSRNITVLGRRTSVRLEPDMWRALKDIARRENCTIHDLCSLVAIKKNKASSLTAAIRVFLMLYYRAACTEEGHRRAHHGSFEFMQKRAGVAKEQSNWVDPRLSNGNRYQEQAL